MRPTVRATYRVQLTPTFDLDRAAAIVPYLARLGISHLYASPLAQATAGSTHGYDVTDHQTVRDELGGEAALRRLWEALDAHAMGMVVDIVPNHMGIRDPSNRWWQDVLRARPLEPLRRLLRHRMAATGPGLRRQGRAPLPRPPLRRRRARRHAARGTPGRGTRAGGLSPRRPLAGLGGLSGDARPVGQRLHRALRRRHRRAPRVTDADDRLPRRPALAGRPLAGDAQAAQLATLLRHHRSGLGARRGARGVRRRPRPPTAMGHRGCVGVPGGARRARRPRRRHGRSRGLPRATPGSSWDPTGW